MHNMVRDIQSKIPVELNLWKTWKGIAIGDHCINNSAPIGKNENSIKKPLPNNININSMVVAKNIVVKPSISNEIVIYKLPSKNK